MNTTKYLRKIITALTIVAITISVNSCSDDMDLSSVLRSNSSMTPPSASGEWKDSRDGNVYGWVRYGDTEWMTENFKYDTKVYADCNDYIDEDDWKLWATQSFNDKNRAKFGMYYSQAGAKAACPNGWRIPTDEDWQKLEQIMGMSAGDTQKRGWRGAAAGNFINLNNNPTYLKMQLGGYVTFHKYSTMESGSYQKGVYAYYWTSTPDTTKTGDCCFYRKFLYNQQGIYRESIETSNQLLNVRYVRDVIYPEN